ncbi:MAG: hypothetical protein H6642_12645 [Caldilineaceae bacterium]|nr:hypothetical protein [Caldilineaceae bacterium]
MTTAVSLPVLLTVSLLLAAGLAYLLRGWNRIMAAISGVYCLAWGGLLWLADLNLPVWTPPLLGRSVDLTAPTTYLDFRFVLTPIGATAISLTLVIIGATLLLSTRFAAPEEYALTPLLLILAGGYTLLFLLTEGPVSPVLLAPIALAALSAVAVFLLSNRGSATVLRILLPPVLAIPVVLIADWYVRAAALDPQNSLLMTTAAQFMGVGYVILLGPVPFHWGRVAAAESAPPLATAAATLLYQLAALFMLFQLLAQFPAVGQGTSLALWLEWAGIVTALWGGVAAFGTLHPGRLWGYVALHDWGIILITLAVAGTRSLPLALFLFSLRAVSMLTAATGLSALKASVGSLEPARLSGAGHRLPWSSAIYLLGGLGLAGFPLSAGFTGHWAALQIMAETDWRPAAAILVASAGAIFSYIRLARILLGPLENRSLRRERSVTTAIAAGILLLSMAIALAPQLLDGPVSRMLIAFSG